MKEKVIIIGASGHGKVVADVVIQAGDQVIGFLDDNTDIGDTFVGFPVLGTVDNFADYLDSKFIVAIGNAEIRESIVKKIARSVLVHSNTSQSSNIRYGYIHK